MSGNYTPAAGRYVAPKGPEALAADLRTGVPECDAFLADWSRCVQDLGPLVIASRNISIAWPLRFSAHAGQCSCFSELCVCSQQMRTPHSSQAWDTTSPQRSPSAEPRRT